MTTTEPRRMRPAPEPPAADKSPVISRERAIQATHNTLKETIDLSIEPVRSALMRAQIRIRRALEEL